MPITSNPPIKLQKAETELHIQFPLQDLDTYFRRPTAGTPSESSPSRYSEYFGPGLRFGTYSFAEDGDEPCRIGLYLYTSKEYPPMSIDYKVALRSMEGQLHLMKTMSYNFQAGEAVGWSKFLAVDQFQNMPLMAEENSALVDATIKFRPRFPIVSKPALDVIHHTIVGDTPSRIRYIVYQTRTKSGKLKNPRALFTTTEALTVHRTGFDRVVEVGLPPIQGTLLGDKQSPAVSVPTIYSEYDSDFEAVSDEEDFDMLAEEPLQRLNSSNTLPRSRNVSGTVPPTRMKSDPDVVSAGLPSINGKTIVVTGVAARTWEAVVYWLYTGTIAFAPLACDGNKRNELIKQYCNANPNRPVPPSCKSVYRVADKLSIELLKKQALQYLESQLTIRTCLHELFGEFTSKFDEVKRVVLVAVIKHWDELKASTALKEKLVEIASGKHPHAAGVMAELFMRASVKEEGSTKAVDKADSA